MIKELFNCDNVGRMKGDARREQILQTAVNLFSQRGFKGTTTKEIARAAGVSEAMVCTLTGLTVSISGLYPVYYFRRRVQVETERLAEKFAY